jgi:hypothetical protein
MRQILTEKSVFRFPMSDALGHQVGDPKAWQEGGAAFSSLRTDRETAVQLVDSLPPSGYEIDLAIDCDDGLSRRLSPIVRNSLGISSEFCPGESARARGEPFA